MTLRDLAKRCAEEGAPIDHSQLSKIESGRVRDPRPQTRAALGRILGLDPLEIGGEPARTAAPPASHPVPQREMRRPERTEPQAVQEVWDPAVGRA